MIENFGILGVGACGSNIANLFEQKQYTTVYVNTSQEDLDAIKGVHKIHIPGAEGAAKDRKRVLQLATESFGDIIQKIESIITQKYVLVAYSSSGGTGSGLSTAVLQYLTQKGRICIPVCVLPDDSYESAKSSENAYNSLVELMNIQGLGASFLLDNSKGDKFAINNKFVNDFDTFLNIKNVSIYGNLDLSERKQLLSCPGVAVIGKSSKTKSTAPEIVESLHNGVFANLESKTAYYLGVITSNKSLDINSISNEFIGVYDTFAGYSESSSVIIATGLEWPTKRILRFKNKLEETVNTRNDIHFTQVLQPLEPVKGLSFNREIQSQPKSTNPRDILLGLLGN